MKSDQDAYFDEAYFERGDERGTAYRDYAQTADASPTFREVAQALATIFQPIRCLEIGCATGAIVRNLNDLGVEAHGVDVSVWAVSHRLHDNVTLAGADQLPFDDDSFDLIYSSHALEHIPAPLLQAAIAEIDRVAAPGAHQFHMLPIVGTYPYDFDHDSAREMLREDPTHNILETMDWWSERWAILGWQVVTMKIAVANDTNGGELSSGQYVLVKSGISQPVVDRAFQWNAKVHREQFLAIERFRSKVSSPESLALSLDDFSEVVQGRGDDWVDYHRTFNQPIAVANSNVNLLVELTSEDNRALRVALIDDSNPAERGVLEFWSEYKSGVSAVQIPVSEFRVLQGRPRLDHIDHLFFGGQLKNAAFRIAGSISSDSDLSVARVAV